MPMETLDEAVLTAIEEHVLTLEAVEQVILLSERDDHSEKQVILDREHQSNVKKITRLLEAIEQGGGSVAAVIEKLRALEREIETERTTMQPVPRLPMTGWPIGDGACDRARRRPGQSCSG
jgi:hypothetical protein